MSTIIARMLGHALRGQGAHVEVTSAIDGLDWQLAGVRPPDAPHSVFRVLNHMIFWQEIYLQRLTGASAPSPARAAEGWPGADAPRSEREWLAAVERFGLGLSSAEALVRAETLEEVLPNWNHRTRCEAISFIASHNSYHIGQIVVLRRILGAWPPPTGGDTW